MKRLIVLFGCVFLLLGGCQEPGGNKSGSTSLATSGVEVIIEGDGKFPEFLVGRWKADKGGWEIVFEPDGTISSAVVTMGRVRMQPGGKTVVPMKKGGKGIFEAGEWMVYYAPSDRELTVEISLKNFYAELGDSVLEGKSRDIFIGPISEDGKVWQVDWTSFPDWVAHTPEHPYFEMAADPNYGVSYTATFSKVMEE